MQRIGTLSGVGALVTPECRHENVRYHLNVWRKRASKSANGVLEASAGAVYAAFEAQGKATLQLADGEQVNVIITNAVGTTGHFEVSGPVPGY